MKLLYIVDGRSPTAINWISYFIHTGHEIHLVSTSVFQPPDGLASFEVIPVALSDIYGHSEVRSEERRKLLRRVVPVELRTRIRQLVAPLTFHHAANTLWEVIKRIQPDLIHAMRIPYEGMIASMAMSRSEIVGGGVKKPPLLVSVWGNDFTLHARSTPVMAFYTRQTLHNCDALHTDCQRDLNL